MTEERHYSILFVCLGNICRSPMAEAVFAKIVKLNGLDKRFSIESAGTAGYHVGDSPDPRTIDVCTKHGVPVNSYAQQLSPKDFDRFDYIIGMDRSNVKDILRCRPSSNCQAKVKLFGEFEDGQVVKDPYYGSDDGFERVYQQCLRYSVGLLEELGFSPVQTITT